MINGDVSVYHSPSESVCKQLDQHSELLGLKFVFSNLLLTTKSIDVTKAVSDFSKSVKSRNERFPVYARVTLVLQVSDKVPTLLESIIPSLRQNPLIECLAIRPATDTQLLDLITKPSFFDIISVDVSNGNFFQQAFSCTKLLKKASDTVIVELELSQSLRGSTELINLVSQTRQVFSKTGNVLVSSGAKSPLEMKSCLDMTNWATHALKLRRPKLVFDRLLDIVTKRRSLVANYT
jgi:RNase P/RNase MRP subunit p30